MYQGTEILEFRTPFSLYAPGRWPEGNRSIIDEKKADLKTLDFDPVGLDDDDLLNLALEMFLDVGVHVRLGIEVFFLCWFLFLHF